MKRFILLLLAIFTGLSLCTAQTCSQFVNALDGKKLVYNNLDPKGNNVNQVSYAAKKKDGSTLIVHSEITDKRGQPGGSGDSEITCSGNAINVDMKSFIPPASARQFAKMDVQADGKYLMYPLDLKAGQALNDGSATIAVNNGGIHFADVNIDITNRKVEGQESVNLSCGNFDCYKITYDIAVKVKIGIIGIPANMHVTEWFSPQIGRAVKTETYDKRNKLAGTMELASIN
ncbi:MAG: hypothetical protein JSU01_01395 [Bacteroidetes bacterium]|nr:hypothetical protein [Bacteroidota bacterium]